MSGKRVKAIRRAIYGDRPSNTQGRAYTVKRRSPGLKGKRREGDQVFTDLRRRAYQAAKKDANHAG